MLTVMLDIALSIIFEYQSLAHLYDGFSRGLDMRFL